MEFISQWLSEIGAAPIVGAAIIAGVTIIASGILRYLGDKIALALSKWSGLGIRNQLFEIIRLPLWLSVILIGIVVEVQWLAPRPSVGLLVSGFAETVLAIIWMIVAAKSLGLVSSRLGGYYPGAAELLRLTENIGILLTVVVGGLLILAIWRIDLTPLIASAGLVGIIVGLAAKDTLGNFIGSISVLIDRPFRQGDYIVLNSGERGKVVHIGLRSTRVLTRDDVLISIPNSVIVNTKVINESAPSRIMRVRMKVSVANTCDVDQAKEVFLKVAIANPLVLSEPEPRARFRAFGDGSLDFELLCWIANPKDKGRVVHQLNTEMFKSLNEEGISLPSPQREVFVHHISDQSA